MVRLLLDRFPGTPIRCLIRPSSDRGHLDTLPVTVICGNIDREEDLTAAMQGVQTVVHIANIRFSPIVSRVAVEQVVRHVILVHTTGMFSKYREYAADYQRIEQTVTALLESEGVKYTIIRPTMIYGGYRDHNFHKLILLLRKVPVFPLFGDGSGKMQPVHAEDLATSIAHAVENPKAFNRAFNIAGGSVHTYREILQMIARLLGRKVWLIPLPFGLSVVLIGLLSRLRLSPVSIEQVKRLTEDKVFDYKLACESLDYRPRDLEAGLRQQIKEMGITSSHLALRR